MTSRPYLTRCKPGTATPAMATWLQRGMVDIVTKDALHNPSTLMHDGALAVSHDIDFGQFDLSTLHDISDDEKDRLTSWTSLQPHLTVRHLSCATTVPVFLFICECSCTALCRKHLCNKHSHMYQPACASSAGLALGSFCVHLHRSSTCSW